MDKAAAKPTPAPKPAKRRDSRTMEIVVGVAAALLAIAVLGACGCGVWRYIEKKNAEHDRQVAALAQQIRDREEADRKAKLEAEAAKAAEADKTENPAAKFVLLKEAFRASLDAKSWEKADNVYAAAQAEGGTEYALAAVGTSTIPSAAKELKEEIEAHRRSYRQIGIMKGKLKKVPDDKQLCESLGLEYASVGDWNGALAAFKSASGEVAKVADWELSKGDAYTAAKAASFWWGYADGKPKAKMEALRLRAAMWYALDAITSAIIRIIIGQDCAFMFYDS